MLWNKLIGTGPPVPIVMPGPIVGGGPSELPFVCVKIMRRPLANAGAAAGKLNAVDAAATTLVGVCAAIGFGITGATSRGTAGNIGIDPGRNIGIASNTAASPHCKVIEPSAVQRPVPEPSNPRDATRLPSNIRHLQPTRPGAHLRGMRPVV
jgi:hypothetical protein